jgi:hypothetical protein
MSINSDGATPCSPPSQMPTPQKVKGNASSFMVEIIKGGMLGGGVITACNPLIYLTNMAMSKTRPQLKYFFSGVAINSLNVIPQTAVQMTISRYALNWLYPDQNQNKPPFIITMFIAALAGASSAVATTPGELLVQQCQQLSGKNPSVKKNAWGREMDLYKHIVTQTFSAGGFKRFTAGMAAVGAREATWAMTYMALAPACIEWYNKRNENTVWYVILWNDIKGAGTAGAIGGVVTSPFQYMRVQKQIHVLDPNPLRSYFWIIQTAGVKGMFTGVHYRAFTVSVACILMTLGKNILYQKP